MKSLSLSKPHLLVMVGAPGSGKSSFAEKFSTMFHAPYVDYDVIEQIGGVGNPASTQYMSYLLKELFKTGHSVLIDGVADTRAQRAELKNLAVAADYKPLFIWVQTDLNTAKSRKLKESKKAGRALSDYEYTALVERFTPPAANEQPIVVISGKHTFASQARVVLKNLAEPRTLPLTNKAPERDTSASGTRHSIKIR